MHEAPVYKPKSERYRRTVAVATSLGLAATVGALAHPNRASASSNRAEAVACTPVLKKGEKPPKIVPPKGEHYTGPKQELAIETAVESYHRANQVANVIINIPIGKKGLGNYFKGEPLDSSGPARPDISSFKSMAGQDQIPNSQLYYQIDYPLCVNVNGENWLIINTERVFPQYSGGAINLKKKGNPFAIWSETLWIKPSQVDKIPGAKVYSYDGVSPQHIIKGHYTGSPGPYGDSAIHFPGISDETYGTISAAPKAAVNNIYKTANQIHNLDQYLGGR